MWGGVVTGPRPERLERILALQADFSPQVACKSQLGKPDYLSGAPQSRHGMSRLSTHHLGDSTAVVDKETPRVDEIAGTLIAASIGCRWLASDATSAIRRGS